MKVPYVDIAAQFKGNREYRRAIHEILDSGQFVLGPAVAEFEKNFARLCGVARAVSVANGTDAIFLALKLRGVGAGDEVITVPNTFLATVGAIAACGAFPRLVDVREDYNIDPSAVRRAVNRKTKAIVPVHLTGNPAPMGEIMSIASERGLAVVEDAAQAVDAALDGKKTGGLGDLGAFSLHPLKNLNTCGDGGVITTGNPEWAEKLARMRNHGLKDRNESEAFAYNFRLDSIKAAVANLQIPGIAKVTEARNRNARRYDEGLQGLAPRVVIPPRNQRARHAFHTYVVQVERRDELVAQLFRAGVETKIHYPIPVHRMEASRLYGYKKGDFPVAEAQAERIVSLPIHQHLSEEQIGFVIETVRGFYGETKE
jgi:dTDP-4-amino-4,6-dideoxygalactose transaminase